MIFSTCIQEKEGIQTKKSKENTVVVNGEGQYTLPYVLPQGRQHQRCAWQSTNIF